MDGAKQIHQDLLLKENGASGDTFSTDPWMIKKSASAVSDSDFVDSVQEDSTSAASFSSADTLDDSSSSSTSSFGPLYELSELMAQLPIKRGLSKCYQGKSQSFASLASVKSLGDLAKKESPFRKKMKTCKSYGGSLNYQRYRPKATITKKASNDSMLSSFGKRGSIMGSCRPSYVNNF